MFEQKSVPQELWIEAEKVNQLVVDLQNKIVEHQKECQHSWEKVMGYDSNYSPRVDASGGEDVIKKFHCSKCASHKTFDERPWQT